MRTAFLLLLFFGSALQAREVPLDKVWGRNLPPLQDVIELERADWQDSDWDKWYRESISLQISSALLKRRDSLGKAFVVPGEESSALARVRDHLCLGTPLRPIRAGERTSLFFYALPPSQGISAQPLTITTEPNKVSVTYAVTTDLRCSGGCQYALIPVGSFDEGEVSIALIARQSNPETEAIAPFVSQSSSFAVEADDLSSVPLGSVWSHGFAGTKKLEAVDPAYRERNDRSVLRQVVLSLVKLNSDDVGKSFLVTGDIPDALQEANRVLSGESARRQTFSQNTPLTAVFYVNDGGAYSSLVSVQESNSEVVLTLRKQLKQTTDSPVYLVLVPISKRPAGALTLRVVEQPTLDGNGLAPTSHSTSPLRGVSQSATYHLLE